MVDALNTLPLWYCLFFLFCLGLCLGSFANVVIYRLPKGESVVKPRSRCGSCGKPVVWYDNIPLLSWIFLRARCRRCRAKISWRYPLVEILSGLLFTGLFYRYGWSFQLLESLVFAWGLLVVSFIDFDHMILPDEFTLSGIVIGLVGSFFNPNRDFISAVIGVLLGGGFLYAIAAIYYAFRKEEGMGGGDIKLLAWIGAVLGWPAIPFVILASSLIGSVVGIAVMAVRKSGLKTSIPFGPYLALAALIYLFGGGEVGTWYIRLFLPDYSPVN